MESSQVEPANTLQCQLLDHWRCDRHGSAGIVRQSNESVANWGRGPCKRNCGFQTAHLYIVVARATVFAHRTECCSVDKNGVNHPWREGLWKGAEDLQMAVIGLDLLGLDASVGTWHVPSDVSRCGYRASGIEGQIGCPHGWLLPHGEGIYMELMGRAGGSHEFGDLYGHR